MNKNKPHMNQITLGTMFDWRWEGKTLKDMRKDFAKELVDTGRIVEAFDWTTDYIKTQFEESKKVRTDATKVKYYRAIFDYEIFCDCFIELMGTGFLIESMKEWDPFPFNDNGEKYSRYKKERFNTPLGIAKDVSDDFVLDLVKGVTDTKLQAELIKSAEGGNPPYPIPDELNKWAKEVIRILLKNGVMKHGDLLSELEYIKSYNCTYLHISQLFQNAFSKKFLKKEITNKNSYYSLTDPDKYTL